MHSQCCAGSSLSFSRTFHHPKLKLYPSHKSILPSFCSPALSPGNLCPALCLLVCLWLPWVFVALHGISLVVVSRVYSSCGVWAPHSAASLVQSTGSECAGFSSCSTWVQLPLSTWNLPRPRIEPTCIGRWILNHWTTIDVVCVLLYVSMHLRILGTSCFMWNHLSFWLWLISLA